VQLIRDRVPFVHNFKEISPSPTSAEIHSSIDALCIPRARSCARFSPTGGKHAEIGMRRHEKKKTLFIVDRFSSPLSAVNRIPVAVIRGAR